MYFEQIIEEFNERHDFEDEDLKVLQQRHPNIQFNNIPTAWIINIDEMLSRIDDIDPTFIISVSQNKTSLCIKTRNNEIPSGRIKDIIAASYNEISDLDGDLNEQFIRQFKMPHKELLN
jgi:hypothetical protein